MEGVRVLMLCLATLSLQLPLAGGTATSKHKPQEHQGGATEIALIARPIYTKPVRVDVATFRYPRRSDAMCAAIGVRTPKAVLDQAVFCLECLKTEKSRKHAVQLLQEVAAETVDVSSAEKARKKLAELGIS